MLRKWMNIWPMYLSDPQVLYTNQEICISWARSLNPYWNGILIFPLIPVASPEVDKIILDFVTVKVRPHGGPIRDHYMLCIVEIKCDDMSEGKARLRMVDYMRQAAGHISQEENLCGYLLMSNRVDRFRMDVQGAEVFVHQEEDIDIFAPGDFFTIELCRIAVYNWNWYELGIFYALRPFPIPCCSWSQYLAHPIPCPVSGGYPPFANVRAATKLKSDGKLDSWLYDS